MKKTNKKGMWIDQEIMDDINLDCVDRFILSEIYSLCKLEKGCIAGDEHFAKLIRQSIPNTNKRINRLKDLGYINTFIHTKNKKIIGRTITIVRKEKNDLVFQNVEVSISKEQDLVFQNVEVSISPVNINNTVTNSDIIIQEINQYTGSTKYTSNSMIPVLTKIFEDLSFKLGSISSIGEEIFQYANTDGIKDLRNHLKDEKEYKLVLPLINELCRIEKQLWG